MFTDGLRVTVWAQIRQHGLRAFSRQLTPELCAEAAKRAKVALGKGPLNRITMVWLAIASAFYVSKNFADLLIITLKILSDAENVAGSPLANTMQQQRRKTRKGKARKRRSKHDPRRSDPTRVSEEAFAKARQKLPLQFFILLILLLADRFVEHHADVVRWKHFRLLAIDGTTINLPRFRALASHFGVANNQKRGPKTPQARLVLMQFPLARMPYRFELSPVHVAEKTLAGRLIIHVQANDLVLLDRGFWSYSIFWEIQNRHGFFGIRCIQKVCFRTLKRLGAKDRLVTHTPSNSKWTRLGYPASITLRLIDYQIKGFRASTVVTNVLDPKVITRDDWVRFAQQAEPGRYLEPGLYHRRWEIETTYNELKVRQGLEGSLRGRTPNAIHYEIFGHLLLYSLVRWLIVEAAEAIGQNPLRLSFTGALRELHDIAPTLIVSSPIHVARVLLPRLLQRIAQHVVPERPGRHYPRPNDTKIKNKGRGYSQKPSKLSRGKG
jgi:hypothetical protein